MPCLPTSKKKKQQQTDEDPKFEVVDCIGCTVLANFLVCIVFVVLLFLYFYFYAPINVIYKSSVPYRVPDGPEYSPGVNKVAVPVSTAEAIQARPEGKGDQDDDEPCEDDPEPPVTDPVVVPTGAPVTGTPLPVTSSEEPVEVPTEAVVSDGAVKFIGKLHKFNGGVVDHDKLYSGQGEVYLNVPYAEPLTRETRFDSSKVIEYPQGAVIQATEFGPNCLQVLSTGASNFDCLQVNVYKPPGVQTELLPVIVYVHGGFFIRGSANVRPKAVIRSLVNRGVVVVSVKYRLGIWGFLTTFNEELLPNRALLDIKTSLQWVQKYIHVFGGDKTKVTLTGFSAGACAVSALALSPDPELVPLFERYLVSSGSLKVCDENRRGQTVESLNTKYIQLLCNITVVEGVPISEANTRAIKACLVQKADSEMLAENEKLGFELLYGPHSIIGSGNMETLAKTAHNRTGVYLAAQEEFGSMFAEFDKALQGFGITIPYDLDTYQMYLTGMSMSDIIDSETEKILSSKIKENYIDLLEPFISQSFTEEQYKKLLIAIFSDGFFLSFMTQEVEALLKNNFNIYLYECQSVYMHLRDHYNITYAGHEADMEKLFPGSSPTEHQYSPADFEEHKFAVNYLADLWSTFAKTGKPKADHSPMKLDVFDYHIVGKSEINRNNYRPTARHSFKSDWFGSKIAGLKFITNSF